MTTVYDWISFKGISPRGERRRGSLEQLVAFLTERRMARSKDSAPGFSATAYKPEYTHTFTSSMTGEVKTFTVTAPGAYRSNAGVESLSALVLDVDHAEPDWQRLERCGNVIVAWQTWSHTVADPHWRLVVPVASAVAVEEWPSAFSLGLERFEPRSDTSCADPSHLFWLPAGPPERTIDIRVLEGAPWAPEGLTVAPQTTRTFTLRTVSDREATAEETDAAHRILAAACRRLAEWPPGAGRQVKCYGVARLVGHLIAAGAISEEEAVVALEHAVDVNGVLAEREYEARRAIARGLAKGVADGAYIFEPLEVLRLRRAEAELARACDLSAQPRPRTYDITTAGGRR